MYIFLAIICFGALIMALSSQARETFMELITPKHNLENWIIVDKSEDYINEVSTYYIILQKPNSWETLKQEVSKTEYDKAEKGCPKLIDVAYKQNGEPFDYEQKGKNVIIMIVLVIVTIAFLSEL
jgi:hypothetical protein